VFITCEPHDGSQLEKRPVIFQEGADPEGRRGVLMHFLERHDRASRAGAGNGLVVTDAIKSKSPVKTVVIKSESAAREKIRKATRNVAD